MEKFDRERVEKELEQLPREQVVQFAWRCALRVLPMLGKQGNFKFWEEPQNHLYAVLFAMDCAAASSAAAHSSFAVVFRLFGSVRASAAARDAAFSALSADSRAVSSAASAAADAVRAARAGIAPASAAAFASIPAVSLVGETAIMEDFEALKRNGCIVSPVELESYGGVWGNFIQALESEGCGYWARLYEQIFADGYIKNQEALERRLNVPKEVRERGAAAVGQYLERLEQEGGERLNEARIIILGEKGAGKTSLARKLIDPEAPMPREDESTPGVETNVWRLDGINVHIWDFAGHVVTHAVHRFFLSSRCLYIMVYDGRSEQRNRLRYWLNHMKTYGGNSEALIVVNERDQHRAEIEFNELTDKYALTDRVHHFSFADDPQGLLALRETVKAYIRDNPSWSQQQIPAGDYRVKEQLQQRFVPGEGSGSERIKLEEFDAIAASCEVGDRDELLRRLHDLGIGLWYEKLDQYDSVILNPEWISHGVYSIINWMNEQKTFQITQAEFAEVFADEAERYPVSEHPFFFELMKQYELAYETQEEEGRLIVPHLLEKDRPETLPEFPLGEGLMARYFATTPLPPDTISRFIVRHNREISKGVKHLVWRHGVVLEDGSGSIALVREDVESRTITISVKGRTKTDYLSTLRETLNGIFDSYKSEKPELQYFVERHGLLAHGKPELWLPEETIQQHIARNRNYFDAGTGREISMTVVQNQYNIDGHAMFGGENNRFDDHSNHQVTNFTNCSIEVRGGLNELAEEFREAGASAEADEMEKNAQALKAVEQCESAVELQGSATVNRLKRLILALEDQDSTLNKTIRATQNGAKIVAAMLPYAKKLIGWVNGFGG